MFHESEHSAEHSETQLNTIRDLMLSAAGRGAWLTLGEIARLTEIGEASVSAQLRHLRKWQHGRYLVQKRLRASGAMAAGASRQEPMDRRRKTERGCAVWEYRVLPPYVGFSAASGGGSVEMNPPEASDAETRN
jgi:hypothetical protein